MSRLDRLCFRPDPLSHRLACLHGYLKQCEWKEGKKREVVQLKKIIPILFFFVILLSACGAGQKDEAPVKQSYTQITQEQAKEMMAKDDGHVIVDVRRQDEYDEGHIPGAILIPNESIGCDSPEALPDYDQIILIYCRSGNRSKQAAEKLAAMGYRNIYEFGGISTWTGEIVTGRAT